MSRAEERRQARESGGSDMRKFYMLFGAVAVIGVGVVAWNAGSGMFGSAVAAPVAVEGLDDLETLATLARGVQKGDSTAEITIIEFGDFQCPSCGAFAQQVKPSVELAYIESGQAKFVFYDYPLTSIHPNAFLAARAARCAEDQGMFWEFHDELFRNQARWAVDPAPAGRFAEYAESVGMNEGEFSSCVNSDAHAELVTANMQLGQVMGVNGTPTIFVNVRGQRTRQTPGFDIQSIQTTIDLMLAEAEQN